MKSTYSPAQTPRAGIILPVAAFGVLGMFSFALACALVLVHPGSLSGDPVRGPVLALTHLVTLGWIGSFLIAGAYLAGPLLADSPLWSSRLPSWHLLFHVTGLATLIGGLAVLRYDVAGIGAIILILGLVLLILNLLITASRRSLWTPANLAFHSALFWLAVTGFAALYMLRARTSGESLVPQEMLISMHAHYALFGFLTQAMLGASLRVVPMLKGAAPDAGRDVAGWVGWALLNTGLLVLFPAVVSGSATVLLIAALMIGIGIFSYALGVFSHMFVKSESAPGWGLWTHAAGILLLLVIMAGAIWNIPQGDATETFRDWMRTYISLMLLGPFAFIILGIGERMVPRLVWQLRYAPWSSFGPLPEQDYLAMKAAGGPVFFSLVFAVGYLAYGQLGGGADAIRLGAILLLFAFAWFAVAIRPALLCLVVGVTPGDLPSTSKTLNP